MHQINIALAVVAFAIVAMGLLSRPIKKGVLQEPLLALALGFLAGPHALGLLDASAWGEESAIREQAARITLAIGLMGVALRLAPVDLRRLWKPVLLLLAVGMAGMWLASSLAAALAFGLPLLPALLLGAAITPTDPVTASAIVSGRFARETLPRRIRSGLSLESGANDGLAYLLVFLPLLFMAHGPGEALQLWGVERVLVGVVLAAALGAAIGYASAVLLRKARERDWIENHSLFTFTIALSLFTLGAAKLIGADALLSVFVAGLVFNLASDVGDEHREERVQESIAKLFSLPMFFMVGLMLPIAAWREAGWPVLAFALLALALRRPPVLALLIPALRGTYRPADTLFLAWFGPIGIAAVYYAALAEKETGDPFYWHAASAAILASVVAHSVSAAPLSRFHARHNRAFGPAEADWEKQADQEEEREKQKDEGEGG